MIELALIRKAAPYLLVLAVMVGTSWWLFDQGYDSGVTEIRGKWDAEKVEHKKAMDKLRVEYATLEANNRVSNQRNSDELAEQDKAHAVAIARLESQYSDRLQLSEQRALRYQRQAQGGAVEQANLASHAAELDRTLEAGRRLVAELTETLRQRDAQLKALGVQLNNDRKLLEESK